MPPLVGVLERRGARRPRGTFAEALLAVPPSGADPPAAASRSSSCRITAFSWLQSIIGSVAPSDVGQTFAVISKFSRMTLESWPDCTSCTGLHGRGQQVIC
jgi:hypothetical protein